MVLSVALLSCKSKPTDAYELSYTIYYSTLHSATYVVSPVLKHRLAAWQGGNHLSVMDTSGAWVVIEDTTSPIEVISTTPLDKPKYGFPSTHIVTKIRKHE